MFAPALPVRNPMETLSSLVLPTLLLILTLAFARMVYCQVLVMRRMARPGGPADIPKPPQSSADRTARMQAFLNDPEYRPLRRSWVASWVWVSASLLTVLMWILATGNGA